MVKDGEKELFFSNSLVITEPSEILLKSATVYWNYNNINDKKKDMDFINVDVWSLNMVIGVLMISKIS